MHVVEESYGEQKLTPDKTETLARFMLDVRLHVFSLSKKQKRLPLTGATSRSGRCRATGKTLGYLELVVS